VRSSTCSTCSSRAAAVCNRTLNLGMLSSRKRVAPWFRRENSSNPLRRDTTRRVRATPLQLSGGGHLSAQRRRRARAWLPVAWGRRRRDEGRTVAPHLPRSAGDLRGKRSPACRPARQCSQESPRSTRRSWLSIRRGTAWSNRGWRRSKNYKREVHAVC
jgi:hypothetical protein